VILVVLLDLGLSVPLVQSGSCLGERKAFSELLIADQSRISSNLMVMISSVNDRSGSVPRL
jgi:hypothetical protein